ncbi:MAG: hypothetical protein M1836_004726 [Candelina mexicana]|nr:MAG: hypothetical protein M1836_004726 [Candelina mexicana]
MSARPALRLFQTSRTARIPFRKPLGHRFQSTEATPTPSQNIFQRLWHSPVGVKTVHFWAPVMKVGLCIWGSIKEFEKLTVMQWGIVLAGVSDFARPAENLSLTQNFALMCTGAIWTRWCFIIKPRNVFLAAVNFFLGCVGFTQVMRIWLYNRSVKDTPISQEVKEVKGSIVGTTKNLVNDPKGVAKEVTGLNVK